MAVYDVYGEKILLQQIAEGNERAFKEVFERYKSTVFTFVVRFIHSKADAEEIVQETFMVLWKNRSQLASIEHPRNYIYTIARNKSYHYLIKASRDQKAMQMIWANMVLESNVVQEELDAKECAKTINETIAQLSPLKQSIFTMSRQEGLSHEQIADATGLSKSRVKNVIVETLKFIKSELSRTALLSLLLYKIQDLFL
jgi:RNA polymerase sigma-70 factor (family 1)